MGTQSQWTADDERKGGPRGVMYQSGAAAHRQLRIFSRRIAVLGAMVAVLVAIATVVLSRTEGVSAWYAFRWAIDTAATVGGFPQPKDALAQVVHVALVLGGIGTLFYALATVTEFFGGGHLGEVLAARRRQKMLDSLSDHHIICGFGRVGRQVARDLYAARARYVVVDTNTENRALVRSHRMHFLEGDATDDGVLLEAGIERARSLVACADADAHNVFITLTARGLRSDLAIVARAAVEDTESKLRRAGASRVISPYKSSGTEMARLALHPQISGIVDVDVEYRMEEIVVDETRGGVGKTLDEIRGGAMIVGLRRGESFQPQPPPDTALQAGDVLVAMGTPTTLARLEDVLEAS